MESLGLLIVLGIAFLASSLGALYLWWHYATPQNRKLALVKAIGQGAVVLNRDHVVEAANASRWGDMANDRAAVRGQTILYLD